MAWPPTIPPNTRQNTTPELDNHPSDHNLISDALTEMSKRAILDSGHVVTNPIAITSGIWDVGIATITPVSVPSRLIINGAFWLTSNAQWGCNLDITDAANVSICAVPVAFLPNAMGNTYWHAFGVSFVRDYAAGANPSHKWRAQSNAGGGTNSAQVRATWLLIAR